MNEEQLKEFKGKKVKAMCYDIEHRWNGFIECTIERISKRSMFIEMYDGILKCNRKIRRENFNIKKVFIGGRWFKIEER